MLGTESFLVMLFVGNEGSKYSKNSDLAFFQRERRAKKNYKDFENEEFWPRLGHK